MIFYKQKSSYTFRADAKDYNWSEEPLKVVDQNLDHKDCPTEWAMNCQISNTEWLFFGGTTETGPNNQKIGCRIVSKLNTASNRLQRVNTKMPVRAFAH